MMANVVVGNKIYIDTASEQITEERTKIAQILFTPTNAGDVLILKETSSGDTVLKISGAVADDTKQFDLSLSPAVFVNGIYVSSLTAGAVATLIAVKGAPDV